MSNANWSRTKAHSIENDLAADYWEYTIGGTTFGMISDPENDLAWVQSDVTVPAVR